MNTLNATISSGPLPDATPRQLLQLKNALLGAEQTGLHVSSFPPDVRKYLIAARTASDHGYAAAFLAVSVLAAIALIAMAILVRPPHTNTAKDK